MSHFRSMGVNPLDVSASALAANRVRMNVIANNLANVNTTRNAEGFYDVYRRKVPVFKVGNPDETSSDKYGVRVKKVRADMSALRQEFQPDHPDANELGYVKLPNVQSEKEVIDMITASRAYEANITAIQVTRQMNRNALELLS